VPDAGRARETAVAVTEFITGAYWFRPDGRRFRLRAVVGRQATKKVDHSFNCRSSVFSGCLIKPPRAMVPVGRTSQSVAKSDSPCFTA